MPLASMTHDVGVQIGENIGRVITVQVDDRGIGWGKFLRIRVEVNISEALLKGVFLTFKGKKTWVPLKYECLPIFCFKCGVIRHAKQSCSISSLGSSKLQYGVWMQALAVKESDSTNKKYGEEDLHHNEEAQSWRKGGEDGDEGPNNNPKSKMGFQETGMSDVDIATAVMTTENMLSPRNYAEIAQRPFKVLSKPLMQEGLVSCKALRNKIVQGMSQS